MKRSILDLTLSSSKNIIKFSLLPFVSKLFSTIAQNIDLILVSRFIGLQEVTILEITRRPISVIRGNY